MAARVGTFKGLRTLALVQYGATVTEHEGGGSYTVRAEAPQGMRWASGVHQLVESTNWPGPVKWKRETWQHLADLMAAEPPEPCTGTACEWCAGE